MSISTDSGLQKAIRQAIQDNKEISYPIIGTKGLLVRIRPKNGKATVDFRHRYTPHHRQTPLYDFGAVS